MVVLGNTEDPKRSSKLIPSLPESFLGPTDSFSFSVSTSDLIPIDSHFSIAYL